MNHTILRTLQNSKLFTWGWLSTFSRSAFGTHNVIYMRCGGWHMLRIKYDVFVKINVFFGWGLGGGWKKWFCHHQYIGNITMLKTPKCQVNSFKIVDWKGKKKLRLASPPPSKFIFTKHYIVSCKQVYQFFTAGLTSLMHARNQTVVWGTVFLYLFWITQSCLMHLHYHYSWGRAHTPSASC